MVFLQRLIEYARRLPAQFHAVNEKILGGVDVGLEAALGSCVAVKQQVVDQPIHLGQYARQAVRVVSVFGADRNNALRDLRTAQGLRQRNLSQRRSREKLITNKLAAIQDGI
jgi:hypothetical protein